MQYRTNHQIGSSDLGESFDIAKIIGREDKYIVTWDCEGECRF